MAVEVLGRSLANVPVLRIHLITIAKIQSIPKLINKNIKGNG